MLKFRFFIHLILGILIIQYVNAATIYGTVYDFSLKKLNNAIVEIDTLPKQQTIAQNGTYSFNVPKGSYTLKAQLMQKNTVTALAQENITVLQDGSYILDLILFPDIEEGVEAIDLDVNEDIIKGINANITTVIAIIAGILIIALLYFLKSHYFKHLKMRKIEPIDKKIMEKDGTTDEYMDKIIKILKQEDGRATQKEFRKHLPFSEGKISLMITELEHKGIVEKIKKGRGNIVILKKGRL